MACNYAQKWVWHALKHEISSRIAIVPTCLFFCLYLKTEPDANAGKGQHCDRSCLQHHSDWIMTAHEWSSHFGCLGDRWRYLPDQLCLLLWWVLTAKAVENDWAVVGLIGYINILLRLRLYSKQWGPFLVRSTEKNSWRNYYWTLVLNVTRLDR